jgi:hypothetical protein
MDTLIHGLRTGIEYGLLPFDALPAFWALTLLSVVSGAFMLWVVGKTTPQRRVEIARARMASAIYEMRLFLDSPVRIVRSQVRMLGWSFAYIGYMLPAFAILTLPLGLLFLHMEARYGQAALPAGVPIVITVSMEPGSDLAGIAPGELPQGVRVTAPPLRVVDESRVYLRAVIDQPGTYALPVRVGNAVVEKRLVADPAATEMNAERCRGACLLASYGDEDPLPGDLGIASIAVEHPDADQAWVPLGMPWWLYWLLVATVAALALRRPMNVTL